MPTLIQRKKRIIPPQTQEAVLARQSSKAISRLLEENDTAASHHFHLNEQEIEIPNAALPLIAKLLTEMGKGRSVMVLSGDHDLTPNQAAEYLGMSRPFLLRLLDNGVIPQHYVGTHRRIKLEDIIAFQAEAQRQDRIMDELVAQAQELDMGY